jgi:hypothetical protein
VKDTGQIKKPGRYADSLSSGRLEAPYAGSHKPLLASAEYHAVSSFCHQNAQFICFVIIDLFQIRA